MNELLSGKTAIITGCNRGIGKAMLEVFTSQGADVFACVRKPSDEFSTLMSELKKKSSTEITPIYFDFADESQIKNAMETIKATKKTIDVLVNNAGVIFVSLMQMTPVAKMKEIFDTNFFSQMLFTQYISKIMMRQKKGSIINFSSSAAIEGNEGRTAYAASKSAMITATKVMSKELAAFQIRVNAIAPGLTQTDMMVNSTPEAALQNTLQRICMKRVGSPEEIANVALFLASELSSYMTGQVLRVDGGM